MGEIGHSTLPAHTFNALPGTKCWCLSGKIGCAQPTPSHGTQVQVTATHLATGETMKIPLSGRMTMHHNKDVTSHPSSEIHPERLTEDRIKTFHWTVVGSGLLQQEPLCMPLWMQHQVSWQLAEIPVFISIGSSCELDQCHADPHTCRQCRAKIK